MYAQLPAGAGNDDMHDLTSLNAKARGVVALVLIRLAVSYYNPMNIFYFDGMLSKHRIQPGSVRVRPARTNLATEDLCAARWLVSLSPVFYL